MLVTIPWVFRAVILCWPRLYVLTYSELFKVFMFYILHGLNEVHLETSRCYVTVLAWGTIICPAVTTKLDYFCWMQGMQLIIGIGYVVARDLLMLNLGYCHRGHCDQPLQLVSYFKWNGLLFLVVLGNIIWPWSVYNDLGNIGLLPYIAIKEQLLKASWYTKVFTP